MQLRSCQPYQMVYHKIKSAELSNRTFNIKYRTSIAYPINKFMNSYIKTFFEQNNISVDEDGYATSEMLQFIWRSAIRDKKEIWIYVPSIKMRTLLEKWIESNTQKDLKI